MARPFTVVAPLYLVLAAVSCIEPPYAATSTPKDAAFDLACIGSCGMGGLESGLLLEVTFTAEAQQWSREYALCCHDLAAFRARLQTVRDFWCDGLHVAPKKVGELEIGTTVSEVTKKRGATIDDGEGYVAFNCGEWLEQLIAKSARTSCCEPPLK